jgi:hypothetical protein
VDQGADEQVIRGSSLIGGGDSGPPTFVDVADGRVTRIRLLHYETSVGSTYTLPPLSYCAGSRPPVEQLRASGQGRCGSG